MPVCLLVRHGRTTANAEGILAGWTPGIELDEHGRGQVAALAQRLRGLSVRRIVSSPLTRCQQTAAILAENWPQAITSQDEDLGECHYGAWTGGKLRELVNEPLWKVIQNHPSAARFPDGAEHRGESIPEMASRAVRAIRSLDAQVAAEDGADSVWLAVSHGDIIKAVLADAAGAHLDHYQRFVVDPASVSVVCYTSSRPFVLRVNDAGADLGRLSGPALTRSGDAELGGGAGR